MRLVIEMGDDDADEMTPDEIATLKEVGEQFIKAFALVEAKNEVYQDAWRRQGWRGNLARILSKSDRLRAMLWRSERLDGNGEPAEETAKDLMTLACFFLINFKKENEWGDG